MNPIEYAAHIGILVMFLAVLLIVVRPAITDAWHRWRRSAEALARWRRDVGRQRTPLRIRNVRTGRYLRISGEWTDGPR